MKEEITKPETFTRDFFELANEIPPPHGESRLATTWFEQLMQKLASQHGVYCQNKQSPRRGEWMNVDHVFIPTNTYAHFPLVAVEHENGDLSDEAKAGRVPVGEVRGAYIEWALWKAIATRAKLAVLVAYPWETDKVAALEVFGKMIAGYRGHFGELPNALLLLGWWGRVPDSPWRAESLYQPYRPVLTAGRVALEVMPVT